MNKQDLIDYFGGSYLADIDQYTHSGWALLDKIPKSAHVLDVGCGLNMFKPYFPNLIGIDEATTYSDVPVYIEEFETDQMFDAILCLGSINFGSRSVIENQVKAVVNLLAPGGTIYWRLNPGRNDHDNTDANVIDFFKWSEPIVEEMAAMVGCRITTMVWDDNNRIYAEWKHDN